MLLFIDNYDSFTHNLVQSLQHLGVSSLLRRPTEITAKDFQLASHLLIGPGPGRPEAEHPVSEALDHFIGKIPILGVCLGHQWIAYYFGARVVEAENIMHGKTSMVSHDQSGVFKGLSDPLQMMRYHSLVVDADTMPDELELTAWTTEGEVMGLRHKNLSIEGVQFHPESILSQDGLKLLKNFIER